MSISPVSGSARGSVRRGRGPSAKWLKKYGPQANKGGEGVAVSGGGDTPINQLAPNILPKNAPPFPVESPKSPESPTPTFPATPDWESIRRLNQPEFNGLKVKVYAKAQNPRILLITLPDGTHGRAIIHPEVNLFPGRECWVVAESEASKLYRVIGRYNRFGYRVV